MDLYILNKEFETVGIVDKYTSLIWTERYKAVDDFEMDLALDDFMKSGIRKDYYIWQKNSQNMMVMEKFELKQPEDEAPSIHITGRGLESILDRRITDKKVTIWNISPDDVAVQFFAEMFTNPENKDRKIDYIRYIDSGDEEIKKLRYKTKVSYESLLNIILDICDSKDLGFKAWFNENHEFCYKFYRGTDRSWKQDNEIWIVYSPKFNNLLSTTFKYDATQRKNHVIVYGEEESQTTDPEGWPHYWPQVVFTMTEDGAVGINRKEGVLDCSDVPRWRGAWVLTTEGYEEKDSDQSSYGWRKLSEPDYLDILQTKAKERLEKQNTTSVYEAEADDHMQWKLGENLYLGDIVQVVSEFGLESRCRIESIIFSHDATGVRYYPTFVAVDDEITQEGGTIIW